MSGWLSRSRNPATEVPVVIVRGEAGALRAYANVCGHRGSEPVRNHQEFLETLSAWKVPGLNFVYADVDGTIGWVAAARTPIRPRHDGLPPVPGNGGFEWTGYPSVRELPQSFNPKAGFLATANPNILPEGYKHQIGYEFAAPYRFQRIQQRLSSQEQWALRDFQALQQDVGSLLSLALAQLLSDVALQDQSLEPFAKLFLEWDGKLTVDAKAGPLYAIWLRMLQDEFYAPHVPKELKSTLRALQKADPLWFGPDAQASRDRLLRSTFAEAVRKLKALP